MPSSNLKFIKGVYSEIASNKLTAPQVLPIVANLICIKLWKCPLSSPINPTFETLSHKNNSEEKSILMTFPPKLFMVFEHRYLIWCSPKKGKRR